MAIYLLCFCKFKDVFAVAPYAGAWIEMILPQPQPVVNWKVAPYAGAWIEMPLPALG